MRKSVGLFCYRLLMGKWRGWAASSFLQHDDETDNRTVLGNLGRLALWLECGNMTLPVPPDMSQIERILIVKVSSLGDVVQALPVSAALGDAFPHVKLTWLVGEQAAPLVWGNPYLHEVIVIPGDWYRRLSAPWRLIALRRELQARRFDMAIDLQGLSPSALIAWLAGARHRFGWDWLRQFSHLLVQRVQRRPESVHVVDQLLDVARFLGAPVTSVKFPLPISQKDDTRALELLAHVGIESGQLFLAINPTDGAGGQKGWGVERFVDLLCKLERDGLPVVLVGGPADRAIGKAIQARARPRPFNLIGTTTIMEMAAILRRAALHVCGDTGSAHVAAALGTSVVSIFGRSNPACLAPYGQVQGVVQQREQCAPVCRRYHETAPVNSPHSCLVGWPICLEAVTVAEVAAAVRKCLGRDRSAGCPVSNSSSACRSPV
jgi:heptosyltransferase I